MIIKLLDQYINFNNVNFIQPSWYSPGNGKYRQQITVHFNGRHDSVDFYLGELFDDCIEAKKAATATLDSLMSNS